MATVQVAAAAAPQTPYVNDRSAFYDPSTDRTYVAFLGLERDLYVTYYDHATDTAATPVKVGDYPITVTDHHGAPSLCLDLSGHIHVVWGSHSNAEQHSRSDNPNDITAWTTQALSAAGTYPSINCDPASGDLIILDRAGSAHGSTFPAHEFLGFRVSTDDGATWGTYTGLADTADAPGGDSDFYLFGSYFAPDGLLHFAWSIAQGSGHDATRVGVYHAKYDHSDGHVYAADGTDLGTSFDYTAMQASCLAASRSPIGVATLTVAPDGKIAVGYSAGDNQTYFSVWDGSSWTEALIVEPNPWLFAAYPAAWPMTNGWLAAVPVSPGPTDQGDVVLFAAPADGAYWAPVSTIVSRSSGEGFARCQPIRGDGPFVALTMQEPTSFANTSATAPDLLPLLAIEDPGDQNVPMPPIGYDAFSAALGDDTNPLEFTHTPVGVPAGVVVFVMPRTTPTIPTSLSVTYGGVAMNQSPDVGVDTVDEFCATYIFWLGEDVPAGPQTIAVSCDPTMNSEAWIVGVSVTADGNLELSDSGERSENQVNPQIVLDTGVRQGLRFCAVFGGHSDVSSFTPLAGMTAVTSFDSGVNVHRVDRQTLESTGSFTIGYTSVSDDIAMAAIALSQVAAPSAPANPAATADSQTQITVSWDDVADETGFRVERSLTGAGAWSDVSGNLAAGTVTYPDTGLTCGTQYFYRVFAFNGGGDSPASTTVDATTDACTPPPSPSGNRMGDGAIRRLGGSR